MLPAITHCSISQQTAIYFESFNKMLLIDILNVRQASVDSALFEFLFKCGGYLNDCLESIVMPGILTTPFITARGAILGQLLHLKQH